MNERVFVDLSRGQQVLGDVMRRQPKRWLALDDDPDGWPLECLPNFLQTDEREGISAPQIHAQLINKLKRFGE